MYAVLAWLRLATPNSTRWFCCCMLASTLGAALTPSDVVRCLPDALVETAEPRSDLELPFVLFDADPAR